MRLRKRASLLLLGVTLAACQPPAPTEGPALDAGLQARALVEGLGAQRTCRIDRDCAVGTSVPACVLGTCFGILTADGRAPRQLLVGRLGQAPAAVQGAAWPLLAKALASPSPMLQLAAVEGVGALLQAQPDAQGQCGPTCLALRGAAAAQDEHVALAAQLASARGGDPSAVPAVLEALQHGTELARAQAARALEPAVAKGTPGVATALLARLADGSAVVQEAAVRGLRPAAATAEVREALVTWKRRTPHLAYVADQVLAGP